MIEASLPLPFSLGWALGAIVSFVALCCVPFLVRIRLAEIATEYRGRLPDGASLRVRATHRLAQAWALVTAAALFAYGASYLYLVGLHCGLLR